MKYTKVQLTNAIRYWENILVENTLAEGLSLLSGKDKRDSEASFKKFISLLNELYDKKGEDFKKCKFEIYIGDGVGPFKVNAIEVVKRVIGEKGVIVIDVDGEGIIKEDFIGIDEVDMKGTIEKNHQENKDRLSRARKSIDAMTTSYIEKLDSLHSLLKDGDGASSKEADQLRKDLDAIRVALERLKKDNQMTVDQVKSNSIKSQKISAPSKTEKGTMQISKNIWNTVGNLFSALQHAKIKSISKQLDGIVLNCRQAHDDKKKKWKFIDINIGNYENIISTVIEKCQMSGDTIKLTFRRTKSMKKPEKTAKKIKKLFT